jgi:hypothetical protein
MLNTPTSLKTCFHSSKDTRLNKTVLISIKLKPRNGADRNGSWHPSYCRHHAMRSIAVDAIDPAGAVRQAGVGADANHGVVSRRSVIAAVSVFARLGSTA